MRSSENTDGLKVKATPGELEKVVPWRRIASNHTAQRPLFNHSETAHAQTGEVPIDRREPGVEAHENLKSKGELEYVDLTGDEETNNNTEGILTSGNSEITKVFVEPKGIAQASKLFNDVSRRYFYP